MKVQFKGEFVGCLVDVRFCANGVVMGYLRPGKPTGSALIESFNGTLWDQCSNADWFDGLTDAQK